MPTEQEDRERQMRELFGFNQPQLVPPNVPPQAAASPLSLPSQPPVSMWDRINPLNMPEGGPLGQPQVAVPQNAAPQEAAPPITQSLGSNIQIPDNPLSPQPAGTSTGMAGAPLGALGGMMAGPMNQADSLGMGGNPLSQAIRPSVLPMQQQSPIDAGGELQRRALEFQRQAMQQSIAPIPGVSPFSPEGQQLYALQSAAGRQALGEILGNQQAQGTLGFQHAQEFGGPGGQPGATLRGAMAKEQENARYGPDAQYATFYNQAYQSNFAPGTPHEARVQQLQSQGMPPPGFLTGEQRGGQGGGTGGGNPLRRPQNTMPDEHQSAINNAFTGGMTSIPSDPTGRSNVTPDQRNHAITNTLAAIPDETLRLHGPAIQQRLQREIPGGQEALDSWIGQNYFTNPLTGSPIGMSPQSRMTAQQIQRWQRIHGQQPAGYANYGWMNYLPTQFLQDKAAQGARGLLGTR